jgi:hypothetical protein
MMSLEAHIDRDSHWSCLSFSKGHSCNNRAPKAPNKPPPVRDDDLLDIRYTAISKSYILPKENNTSQAWNELKAMVEAFLSKPRRRKHLFLFLFIHRLLLLTGIAMHRKVTRTFAEVLLYSYRIMK